MRPIAWCCRAGYVQMKQAAACASWVLRGFKRNGKLIDPKGNAEGFKKKRESHYITGKKKKMELTFA